MEYVFGRALEHVIKSNNLEDITICDNGGNITLRYLHIAEEDGRIYTNDSYISYKKGQAIAYLDVYGDFYCNRPIVFDTVEDLKAILEAEKKKYEEDKAKQKEVTEKICSDRVCDCVCKSDNA